MGEEPGQLLRGWSSGTEDSDPPGACLLGFRV